MDEGIDNENNISSSGFFSSMYKYNFSTAICFRNKCRSYNVTVTDVSTDKVVDTVDVGDSPSGVAATTDGKFCTVPLLST